MEVKQIVSNKGLSQRYMSRRKGNSYSDMMYAQINISPDHLNVVSVLLACEEPDKCLGFWGVSADPW